MDTWTKLSRISPRSLASKTHHSCRVSIGVSRRAAPNFNDRGMERFLKLIGSVKNRVSKAVLRAADNVAAANARKRLQGHAFTLVTNNCWGAHIYQILGRAYQSPFIGLFIPPEDYMRLIPDVVRLVRSPVEFIGVSRHEAVEDFRARRELRYPIGLLGSEVELHFMHYQSREEAAEKWGRRTARCSWDRNSLFFKFCDHDGATDDQLRAFDDMAELSRVCFVGRRVDGTARAVFVKDCVSERVPDGGELSKLSPRYFSVVDWIKSGGGGGMRPWLCNRL